VPDSNQGTGRLIVYVSSDQRGDNLEVWIGERPANKVYANVVERTVNGRPEYSAIFPGLPAGTHALIMSGPRVYGGYSNTKFTIFADNSTEIDKR